MPCDQGHQALFLRGSSGGVTCLFITGWWLLPPEKTNRSNEAQGNYVADIAFASATSLGSLKKCGKFFFWNVLGDAVWCAVRDQAQCRTSFQFIFIWYGQYTLHVSRSKSCWFLKSREKSFFSTTKDLAKWNKCHLRDVIRSGKKNGATTLPSPKCNLPLWVVVFYVIENILKHFDLDIEIIFWNIRNSTFLNRTKYVPATTK